MDLLLRSINLARLPEPWNSFAETWTDQRRETRTDPFPKTRQWVIEILRRCHRCHRRQTCLRSSEKGACF